jgi:hypothetical protein
MDSFSGPSQSQGPSQYQYEPLPDPRTHVRLLQIQQCHPDTTIQCKFTSWLLEDAPAYHAISYTWGDPKLTTNILIVKRQGWGESCSIRLWEREAYVLKGARTSPKGEVRESKHAVEPGANRTGPCGRPHGRHSSTTRT